MLRLDFPTRNVWMIAPRGRNWKGAGEDISCCWRRAGYFGRINVNWELTSKELSVQT